MSKEIEPTQIKKKNSYTYWVDEKNKSRELPEQHRPKKIQAPVKTQQSDKQGPSKWNSLGSWQERSVSMSELTNGVEKALTLFIQENKYELVLKKVRLEGEFKRIFSNNKKKILFDIRGGLEFEGEKLELELLQLTDSGDRDYCIKGNNPQRATLQSVAVDILESLLREFSRYKQ